jgi:uncharacterized UPF0160 family protein
VIESRKIVVQKYLFNMRKSFFVLSGLALVWAALLLTTCLTSSGMALAAFLAVATLTLASTFFAGLYFRQREIEAAPGALYPCIGFSLYALATLVDIALPTSMQTFGMPGSWLAIYGAIIAGFANLLSLATYVGTQHMNSVRAASTTTSAATESLPPEIPAISTQERTNSLQAETVTQSNVTIATHGGAFHADDLMGVAVLLALNPDAAVIRTRNLDKIATATYAVDVGGEWDSARGRFDHHQKGFAHTRANGTKYAAAGLVWSTQGAAYVASIASELSAEQVERVVTSVDEQLIRHVDMTDTGEGYSAQGQFGLSLLLSNFNFSRLEEHRLPGPASDEVRASLQFSQFMEALGFSQRLLRRLVLQLADEQLAEVQVRGSERLFDGRVLVLEATGLAWQNVVVNEMPDVLYVAYPDRADGGYMLQAVPTEVGGFVPRKPLPEPWAGLRFKDLAAVTNVKSSVFCHNKRFIAGAGNRGDVLALAELALG